MGLREDEMDDEAIVGILTALDELTFLSIPAELCRARIQGVINHEDWATILNYYRGKGLPGDWLPAYRVYIVYKFLAKNGYAYFG